MDKMKRLVITATLILAGVVLYTAAVHAQQARVGKADPVNVDPKHYKVEFENERVRVLRVSYGPGEKSVMHYNPDSVIVSLTGDKTRMTTPAKIRVAAITERFIVSISGLLNLGDRPQ